MSSCSSVDDFGFEEEPVRIMSVQPVNDDDFSDEREEEKIEDEEIEIIKPKKNKRKSKKMIEKEEEEIKPKKNKRKSKKKIIKEEEEESEEEIKPKKNKRKSKKKIIKEESEEEEEEEIKPKKNKRKSIKKIKPKKIREEESEKEISDIDELLNQILESDNENDYIKEFKKKDKKKKKKKVIIIEESDDDEYDEKERDDDGEIIRFRKTSKDVDEKAMKQVRLTKYGKPDRRCFVKRTKAQMEAVEKMKEAGKKHRVEMKKIRDKEAREMMDEAYEHRLSQTEKKRTEMKQINLEKKLKEKEERLRLANEALDRILSGNIKKVEKETPDFLTPDELQTATEYARKHRWIFIFDLNLLFN